MSHAPTAAAAALRRPVLRQPGADALDRTQTHGRLPGSPGHLARLRRDAGPRGVLEGNSPESVAARARRVGANVQANPPRPEHASPVTGQPGPQL